MKLPIKSRASSGLMSDSIPASALTLGIDLGTSAVKAVILDSLGTTLAGTTLGEGVAQVVHVDVVVQVVVVDVRDYRDQWLQVCE